MCGNSPHRTHRPSDARNHSIARWQLCHGNLGALSAKAPCRLPGLEDQEYGHGADCAETRYTTGYPDVVVLAAGGQTLVEFHRVVASEFAGEVHGDRIGDGDAFGEGDAVTDFAEHQ